jgi:hypothetical protein
MCFRVFVKGCWCYARGSGGSKGREERIVSSDQMNGTRILRMRQIDADLGFRNYDFGFGPSNAPGLDTSRHWRTLDQRLRSPMTTSSAQAGTGLRMRNGTPQAALYHPCRMEPVPLPPFPLRGSSAGTMWHRLGQDSILPYRRYMLRSQDPMHSVLPSVLPAPTSAADQADWRGVLMLGVRAGT